MDLKVTSLQDLKKVSEGEIVELPPFSNKVPFCARVKRVSLLGLVTKGIIPNSLLSAAEEIFYGKSDNKGNVDMKKLTEVMFRMAQNTLVEPSIEQLNEIGLELTDEQIIALFNYSQQGVKELEPFRENEQNTEYISDK